VKSSSASRSTSSSTGPQAEQRLIACVSACLGVVGAASRSSWTFLLFPDSGGPGEDLLPFAHSRRWVRRGLKRASVAPAERNGAGGRDGASLTFRAWSRRIALGCVEASNERTACRSRRCRVLVVEDDDLFVQALTELLEADGRIQIAARAFDGREGVALAETLRPDVVLMDIQLPVMDGIKATRELRRRHPLLPVVAITGSEYQERALEARQAGAVDYVRKGRLGPDLTEVILAAADRASRQG
jgi:CheY-like chemotaxis protein